MEEKIKIHLSKNVYDTLIKDCEAFEFFKSDGITLNKNAFLIALVNNYYLSYQCEENNLLELVSKTIEEVSNVSNIDEISKEIVGKLNKMKSAPNKEKVSSVISLKPTKDSQAALSYIENYLLKDCSISEFFRNLFTSYSSLPQDQREKIIFKEQYDTILKAIKRKKKIFFTTKRGKDSNHESHPYAIATSKEELHCYLLTKFHDECRSYRLNRIQSVTILNEESKFLDDEVELFEKMIKYGPEFMYDKNEGTIMIYLTERGKQMYHTHYVHRPIVDFVEGNYYTFSCSYDQIYSYFRRFGKEAFIVTPKELQLKIYQFHKKAKAEYEQRNRLNKK